MAIFGLLATSDIVANHVPKVIKVDLGGDLKMHTSFSWGIRLFLQTPSLVSEDRERLAKRGLVEAGG